MFPFPRLPSFSRPSGAGTSLGVAAEGKGVAAAILRRTAGAQPRLLACHHFDGDQALGALSIWRNGQGLRRSKSNLLLSADDYQLLPIETLDLPQGELTDAARWKVKDMIDFPAEEAAVACVLVPAAEGATHMRHALAVVTPRQTVARWMQRTRQAQCQPDTIDIPELALRNILSLLPSGAACGLLHVGLARTTLVMVWRGELCTSRRFDLSAGQLLAADEQRRLALVERLALDLQRSCDAFERQFHAAALGRIWVMQAHPDLALAQALKEHVSLDVQPLDLRECVDIDAPEALLDPERGIDFIPAIGAALRDTAPPSTGTAPSQQINLFDATLLPPRDWCTGRNILVSATLLASGVAAHGAYEGLALNRVLAANASAPAPAHAPTDASPAPTADGIDTTLREAQQQLARDRSLLDAVTGLSDLPLHTARRLDSLIAAMPNSVWLREVEFSGARSVRIVGGALDPAALAGFSQRLGQAPAFGGLPLHVYTLEPLASLDAQVTPATPATPETPTQPRLLHAPVPYGFVLSSVDADPSLKAAP
jgi:MSHA biogenesis protein MshI